MNEVIFTDKGLVINYDNGNAKWKKKADAQHAADRPYLDAMHREVAKLIANISDDCMRVDAILQDDGGMPDFSLDGIALSWHDVNINYAYATRPGALNAFATECVAYISREKFEAIKAAQATEKNQKIEKDLAYINNLTGTPVPENAIRAYKQYGGNAEAAWEAEDEFSSALIRRWAPYIEVQFNSKDI